MVTPVLESTEHSPLCVIVYNRPITRVHMYFSRDNSSRCIIKSTRTTRLLVLRWLQPRPCDLRLRRLEKRERLQEPLLMILVGRLTRRQLRSGQWSVHGTPSSQIAGAGARCNFLLRRPEALWEWDRSGGFESRTKTCVFVRSTHGETFIGAATRI